MEKFTKYIAASKELFDYKLILFKYNRVKSKAALDVVLLDRSSAR